MKNIQQNLIETAQEKITDFIFLIRGKKVMFDRDLAHLYGVGTKVLNQAVKRNLGRFPEDFMFQLNAEESNIWHRKDPRSQFVTLESGKNIKYLPYVFTEQGVAMLSSVLKSEKAVQVNIQIVRTFTRLRQMLSENEHLSKKLEELEKKYDGKIAAIFEVLNKLLVEEEKPKIQIGFC